jgi:polar amino acid transport system substrate-binding protein
MATNARDAMQKGGLLTIETTLQSDEFSLYHDSGRAEPGPYAVLTVTDNGCGMDVQTLAKIFEPFFTTKEVGKGTGLGMSIVYGIIKQHGGYIDVSSEPGQGTTFRVYLPVLAAKGGVAPVVAPAAALPQGGTETILLAADDPDVRKLGVTLLTEFGYTVIQAVDGQDVVDKFAANWDKVALILMDMIMPRKNGKEAYDEISLLQPGVKVLYLSGYTADFIQNRGLSEEGIELVMKPVQPKDLLRKVREMIDGRTVT